MRRLLLQVSVFLVLARFSALAAEPKLYYYFTSADRVLLWHSLEDTNPLQAEYRSGAWTVNPSAPAQQEPWLGWLLGRPNDRLETRWNETLDSIARNHPDNDALGTQRPPDREVYIQVESPTSVKLSFVSGRDVQSFSFTMANKVWTKAGTIPLRQLLDLPSEEDAIPLLAPDLEFTLWPVFWDQFIAKRLVDKIAATRSYTGADEGVHFLWIATVSPSDWERRWRKSMALPIPLAVKDKKEEPKPASPTRWWKVPTLVLLAIGAGFLLGSATPLPLLREALLRRKRMIAENKARQAEAEAAAREKSKQTDNVSLRKNGVSEGLQQETTAPERKPEPMSMDPLLKAALDALDTTIISSFTLLTGSIDGLKIAQETGFKDVKSSLADQNKEAEWHAAAKDCLRDLETLARESHGEHWKHVLVENKVVAFHAVPGAVRMIYADLSGSAQQVRDLDEQIRVLKEEINRLAGELRSKPAINANQNDQWKTIREEIEWIDGVAHDFEDGQEHFHAGGRDISSASIVGLFLQYSLSRLCIAQVLARREDLDAMRFNIAQIAAKFSDRGHGFRIAGTNIRKQWGALHEPENAVQPSRTDLDATFFRAALNHLQNQYQFHLAPFFLAARERSHVRRIE
jgi:hypothetical protein